MHNYNDTNLVMPYGPREIPATRRHSWVPALWPFIEQQGLYSEYNFNVGFYLPPNTIGGGNAATANLDGPTGKRVKIYYCPSDRVGAVQTATADPYWRAKGNYQLNWGHLQIPDPVYTAANPRRRSGAVWLPRLPIARPAAADAARRNDGWHQQHDAPFRVDHVSRRRPGSPRRHAQRRRGLSPIS